MNQTSILNWKRGALSVLSVGALTLLAVVLAKQQLAPEAGRLVGAAHEGHVHGTAGPFFENLFKVYTPRRVCMFHEPGVIWLHFISDFLISLSYFSIPVALVYFVRRRRDLKFSWIFWMFAAFILFCGTTHFVGMWDLWQPLYKIDGLIKLATGLVSVVTAVTLWPLIPRALALPSPAQLELRVQERTAELALANEERQRALERERALRVEAEEASRIKDEFLANLSHELRTPLNAIFGWAQILRRRLTAGEEAHALEIIERNTRAQAQLIEDLLDLSRIVKGNLRLEDQSVELQSVVDAALDAVRPAALGKEIQLQKTLLPEAAIVRGDPARLQQIFWNLLTNAVKFTPKGGRVQVFMERSGAQYVLTVTDTGIGISPEFLPLIFTRFQQADSSITRPFGGLGIGLAIARHLVELHGGVIQATSPGPGQGAAFTVTLPVAEVVSADGHPSLTPVTQADFEAGLVNLDGLKVLAIDDESDTLLLLRTLLEEAGAEVYTADRARTGLAILKEVKPGVVLCDLAMPDEDGYSFLLKVRRLSSEEGGDIPVIAVTAFARAEDRAKAERAGFESHIVKPFEPPDLLFAVLRAVQGKTAAA